MPARHPGSYINRSSWQDVSILIKRYPGRNLTLDGHSAHDPALLPVSCSPQNCMWGFIFYNKWLEKLRLAPRIEFLPGVEVKDGLFIGRGFSYASLDVENGAFTTVDESLENHCHKGPFWVHAMYAADGKPNRIYIEMTPGVSPEQFASAWNVNLACLSKLGECPDRTQILPPIPKSREPWTQAQ